MWPPVREYISASKKLCLLVLTNSKHVFPVSVCPPFSLSLPLKMKTVAALLMGDVYYDMIISLSGRVIIIQGEFDLQEVEEHLGMPIEAICTQVVQCLLHCSPEKGEGEG